MNQAQDNWEISPAEVRDMLERGEPFAFLDCRTPEEHTIARVDAARLVPMQDVPERSMSSKSTSTIRSSSCATTASARCRSPRS